MANFPKVEQALRTWVHDAIEFLYHTEPDVSPGLARWQLDSDGLFRKRERPTPVWQHGDLEAVRQLPSWHAVERALQDDERLRAHLDQLVGTAEGGRRFDVETAGRLVLPLPDEVSELDVAFARRYDNLDGFLASEEIQSVVVWPLPGMTSDQFPIQLQQDIELDVLSDDELAAVLNAEVLRPFFSDIPFDPTEDISERACLRYGYRLPKVIGGDVTSQKTLAAHQDRLNTIQENMEQVLALSFADPVAISGQASMHTDWLLLSGGVKFQQVPLTNAQRFRRVNLDTQAAMEVVDTWQRLRQPGLLQRQKALALALRRFSYQAYRQRAEDELVDILVAAEALYLSDLGPSELGFRFALRASAFSDVAKLGMTRREVFDMMKAAYNVRSKIVHGDEPKPKDMKVKDMPKLLPEFVQASEEVVRQGLKKALAEAASSKGKWPPDWDGLTLPN
jgi:hypothetical protein